MKNQRRYCFLGTALFFLVLMSACSNPFFPPKKSIDPDVRWPNDIEMLYGQKLSARRIDLYANRGTPGVFAWARPTDSVGSVGINFHNVTFTPDDTMVYNTVTNNIPIRVLLNVDMVSIPGGSFTMGSPTEEANRNSDETQRQVTLSAFRMGKYEVTQEQYEAVMKTNPSWFTISNNKQPAPGETAVKRPVEQVSWYDAIVFCNKLSIAEGFTPAYRINNSTDPAAWGPVPGSGDATWNGVAMVPDSDGYRLPTEAQWEYAAKGGNNSPGNYIYAGSNTPDNVAWYTDNSETDSSGKKTHEVGKKTANGLVLYDMSGNVAEWCWDWYGAYPSVAQTDPVGVPTGTSISRVFRGGSWLYSDSDARSACRSRLGPSSRLSYIGFRLVRPTPNGNF